MYKQRCVGAEGPLMPTIFICSWGLMLFSATDAGIRAFGWPGWAFAVCLALLFGVSLVIHRYTRVAMEYVWFGGELIVRRYENGRITRFVLNGQELDGMRDRKGAVGRCIAGRTRNFCATLHGRLTGVSLYYHDQNGRAWRVVLQPSAELRDLLWCAANVAVAEKNGK